MNGLAGLQGGQATIWASLGLMSIRQSVGSFPIDTRAAKCVIGTMLWPGTPPMVGTAMTLCQVVFEDGTGAPTARSVAPLNLDFAWGGVAS